MENAKTYYEVPTQVQFKNADPEIDDDNILDEMEDQELTIFGEWDSPLEQENVVIIWAIISEEIKGD